MTVPHFPRSDRCAPARLLSDRRKSSDYNVETVSLGLDSVPNSNRHSLCSGIRRKCLLILEAQGYSAKLLGVGHPRSTNRPTCNELRIWTHSLCSTCLRRRRQRGYLPKFHGILNFNSHRLKGIFSKITALNWNIDVRPLGSSTRNAMMFGFELVRQLFNGGTHW